MKKYKVTNTGSGTINLNDKDRTEIRPGETKIIEGEADFGSHLVEEVKPVKSDKKKEVNE